MNSIYRSKSSSFLNRGPNKYSKLISLNDYRIPGNPIGKYQGTNPRRMNSNTINMYDHNILNLDSRVQLENESQEGLYRSKSQTKIMPNKKKISDQITEKINNICYSNHWLLNCKNTEVKVIPTDNLECLNKIQHSSSTLTIENSRLRKLISPSPNMEEKRKITENSNWLPNEEIPSFEEQNFRNLKNCELLQENKCKEKKFDGLNKIEAINIPKKLDLIKGENISEILNGSFSLSNEKIQKIPRYKNDSYLSESFTSNKISNEARKIFQYNIDASTKKKEREQIQNLSTLEQEKVRINEINQITLNEKQEAINKKLERMKELREKMKKSKENKRENDTSKKSEAESISIINEEFGKDYVLCRHKEKELIRENNRKIVGTLIENDSLMNPNEALKKKELQQSRRTSKTRNKYNENEQKNYANFANAINKNREGEKEKLRIKNEQSVINMLGIKCNKIPSDSKSYEKKKEKIETIYPYEKKDDFRNNKGIPPKEKMNLKKKSLQEQIQEVYETQMKKRITNKVK